MVSRRRQSEISGVVVHGLKQHAICGLVKRKKDELRAEKTTQDRMMISQVVQKIAHSPNSPIP